MNERERIREEMEEITYNLRHLGARLVTEDENGIEREVELDYGKIEERLNKRNQNR